MNQKGFVNIIVIVLVVILTGTSGYFVLKQQTQLPQPIQESSTIQPQPKTENNTSQPVDTSKETSPNNTQQIPPKKTETPKPIQNTQNNLKFGVLYPPTPSSFGCNPYAGTYETQQGKVVQTYDQWQVLYGELLKNCYTKTNAPQIIDFDKQTMIAVFGGRSCTTTQVEVKTVSVINNKLVVHSVVTVGGCALPSFSSPFTLISMDKSHLPIDFTFESAKNPSEPF